MTLNKALFTSLSPHWNTPKALYDSLNQEFHFTLDPCPPGGADGLTRSWIGERVYCNPPYGRGVNAWLEKRIESDIAVFLLPARTDTAWSHNHALQADEIRFIRGRLHFSEKGPAPFPSIVLIFKNE